jgi:hypothetical protein
MVLGVGFLDLYMVPQGRLDKRGMHAVKDRGEIYS